MSRVKFENTKEYFISRCTAEGNVGTWAQSLFNACDSYRNATAGKMTKIKDVEAVIEAARFWHDKSLSAQQVIQEYLSIRGGPPAAASTLLTGVCKATESSEIWAKIQGDLKAVQLMGCDIIDAEDRRHAGSMRALMEYEGALAYTHQALRGCAGSLDIGEPQLEVLRSYLRDIKPWIRCCLSNYDPVVMERWGAKAREELATRSDLAAVLRQKGYDLQPILKPK